MSNDFSINEGMDNDGDELVIDLSGDDLTGGEYPLMPVGTWVKASVYEAELVKSKSEKNEGKPMYKLVLKFHPEAEAKWGKGRRTYIYAPLWSGAFFTAYKVLKALGYEVPKPPKEGERLQFRAPSPKAMLGQVLDMKVSKHETYNGNTRERFEHFEPVGTKTEDGEAGGGLDAFASGGSGLFE